jgi:hypothetical protein
VDNYGHWTYNLEEKEIPNTFYGFIYQITNTTNDRKYIGKKQSITILKRPPLKGRKNKRHVVKETDWKIYTGSSDKLNEDIQKLGKGKFKFEILRFCQSKSELAYYEAKMQFDNDVLLKEEYYNGIINLRLGKIKKT